MNKRSGKKDSGIRPESTWGNEYIESFNGMPTDEFLDAGEGGLTGLNPIMPWVTGHRGRRRVSLTLIAVL